MSCRKRHEIRRRGGGCSRGPVGRGHASHSDAATPATWLFTVCYNGALNVLPERAAINAISGLERMHWIFARRVALQIFRGLDGLDRLRAHGQECANEKNGRAPDLSVSETFAVNPC